MSNIKKLSEFKESIIEIGNLANKQNIDKLSLLIQEIQKYISVNIERSKQREDSYQRLEVLNNYIDDLPIDSNNTALIVIKSQIVSEIDSILTKKTDLSSYDVFVSHASSDKLTYVNELEKEIEKLGVNIFYDSKILKWGDNWKQTILEATAKSQFAIIVISSNFFGREWTEKELNEFIRRQNDIGQKIVLPLIYNVSASEVIKKYPFLEDIQYLNTKDYSKKDIAIKLAELLIEKYKKSQQ